MKSTLPFTATITPSPHYAWDVVTVANDRIEMVPAAFNDELSQAILRAGIALTRPETVVGRIFRRTEASK